MTIYFVTVTLELMEHKYSIQRIEPVLISSLVYTQESPRKRVVLTEDGPGQIQEVKAIQQTRRLLANARERTRVHTISAAFEALRKQVRSSVMTETSLIRGHTHTYVPQTDTNQNLSPLRDTVDRTLMFETPKALTWQEHVRRNSCWNVTGRQTSAHCYCFEGSFPFPLLSPP